MKINKIYGSFLSSLLLCSSLSAMDFETSVGVHDFVVSDIVDDVPQDGISSGTSHTLGANIALYVKHTTHENINMLAKAEVFFDYDKDNLDPDHIPIWFSFLIDIDGDIYKINENHKFKWYILADNRQNTVSCVEREVRQHIGVGYTYKNGGLDLNLNAYSGFYYIEIDDDTPVARGYERQQMDDGEASNVFQFEGSYSFNSSWNIYFNAKRYSANTGMERLEDNYELHLQYKGAYKLADGSTLNLKIKNVQYDLDRFTDESIGVAILPFDNDTLIQAYVTVPITF
jgi:hypothetical protein